MRPGKLTMLVILGLPWQRTYNGLSSWKREGITFEFEDQQKFASFLGNKYYSFESNSEEKTGTNSPVQQTSKVEKSIAMAKPLSITQPIQGT